MLTPSDPAVVDFLRRAMIVQLATISAAGRPFVTPLWFVVDAGILYVTTGPETRAGRNIARHPDVTLLFGGERATPSEQVLRLRGTATRHYQLPSWRVLARVALKYYVAPRGLGVELAHAHLWRLRRCYYAQAKGGFGHLCVMPTAAELLTRP
jgi:pyridoxamine 5'-phosphate oxidase-like protein